MERFRQRRFATRGDAQAVVDSLPDSLAEVDVEMLGDTLSFAHALVKSLAETLEEMEA